MAAGARDTLIEVQSSSTNENAMGGRSSKVWTKLVDAWAEVRYGTGAERRVLAQEASDVVATFQIPTSTNARNITAQHRLIIKGESGHWDITSAVPNGRNKIDITAKRIMS